MRMARTYAGRGDGDGTDAPGWARRRAARPRQPQAISPSTAAWSSERAQAGTAEGARTRPVEQVARPRPPATASSSSQSPWTSTGPGPARHAPGRRRRSSRLGGRRTARIRLRRWRSGAACRPRPRRTSRVPSRKSGSCRNPAPRYRDPCTARRRAAPRTPSCVPLSIGPGRTVPAGWRLRRNPGRRGLHARGRCRRALMRSGGRRVRRVSAGAVSAERVGGRPRTRCPCPRETAAPGRPARAAAPAAASATAPTRPAPAAEVRASATCQLAPLATAPRPPRRRKPRRRSRRPATDALASTAYRATSSGLSAPGPGRCSIRARGRARRGALDHGQPGQGQPGQPVQVGMPAKYSLHRRPGEDAPATSAATTSEAIRVGSSPGRRRSPGRWAAGPVVGSVSSDRRCRPSVQSDRVVIADSPGSSSVPHPAAGRQVGAGPAGQRRSAADRARPAADR